MTQKTMTEIESMTLEEFSEFLAWGDPLWEELDASTKALLELTCIDVPKEGE